jgi:predicted transcriptional regulator
MVLPAEGRDHIGCFADQVELTRALVQDLDEAVKEIQQLGNHGEEASWKITELEALCKQHANATKKMMEEKAKLEGMIKSHDELIM